MMRLKDQKLRNSTNNILKCTLLLFAFGGDNTNTVRAIENEISVINFEKLS